MAEQSNTFCPLPFIHSHASVNGHWKPCCNSTHHDITDNYFETETSHIDWFTSQPMNKLRSDMLSGVQNSMCDICWKSESISGKSIRKRYIEKFKDIVDVNNPQIRYLDLKLSNECNLSCRMCDYTNSNKILNDVKQIEEQDLHLPENWKRSPKHENYMNVKGIKTAPKHILDEVESLLPNIKILKLTGGEPTVAPEVLKLFDICIDKGHAKNIQLNITTNATKFTEKFLEKIKSFDKVTLNISCDGYGKVYDYIRYPFNWQKFVERVDNVVKAEVAYSITTVPQMYNIENIYKLQEWNSTVGNDTIFLNTFLQPENNYNSLKFVPIHILKYALTNISTDKNNTVLIDYIKSLIKKNYQPTDIEYTEIVKSVSSIDKVRNQNYRDYLEPMTTEWLEGLFKKYA